MEQSGLVPLTSCSDHGPLGVLRRGGARKRYRQAREGLQDPLGRIATGFHSDFILRALTEHPHATAVVERREARRRHDATGDGTRSIHPPKGTL